jgi:hypothetical protein
MKSMLLMADFHGHQSCPMTAIVDISKIVISHAFMIVDSRWHKVLVENGPPQG